MNQSGPIVPRGCLRLLSQIVSIKRGAGHESQIFFFVAYPFEKSEHLLHALLKSFLGLLGAQIIDLVHADNHLLDSDSIADEQDFFKPFQSGLKLFRIEWHYEHSTISSGSACDHAPDIVSFPRSINECEVSGLSLETVDASAHGEAKLSFFNSFGHDPCKLKTAFAD